MTWINHSSTFLLNRLSIFYIIFSVDLEFLLLWIGCHIYWRHLALVRSLIPKSGFRSRAVRFRAPSLGVVGKMSLLFLILWMLIRPDNRLFASRPLCGAVRRRINHLSGFAVYVTAARLFGGRKAASAVTSSAPRYAAKSQWAKFRNSEKFSNSP